MGNESVLYKQINEMAEKRSELKTWNGWQVEQLIGEGAFGNVYRIVRQEFGQTYESALKVLRIPQSESELKTMRSEGMSDENLTEYYRGVIESIVSEFALMYQLKGSSYIVNYEDHSVEEMESEFGWTVYIRMELLTPLVEFLQENSLSVADVIRMGTDMCRALEICHEHNIIHRDIKPENIFCSRQGTFKLGDFGIARELEKTTAGLSKKGTFSYMAPEVYKGMPYNSTVDIYSLGIVLYRFLNNNRTPFLPDYPAPIRHSDRENANIRRMSGEPLPPPCNGNGQLAEVVLKACAYDPKDRYESAAEMREALEAVAGSGESESSVKRTAADETPDDDPAGHPSSNPEDGEREPQTPEEEEKSSEAVTPVLPAEEQTRTPTTEEETSILPGEEETSTLPGGERKPQKKRWKKTFIWIAAAVAVLVCVIPLYTYYNHTVPNLQKMTPAEAKAALQEAGLTYQESGREFSDEVERGSIVSQSREYGDKVKKGTAVEVTISLGKRVTVPDVTGEHEEDALKMLKKAGLKARTTEVDSDEEHIGIVVKQSEEAGSFVAKETTVIISVGTGDSGESDETLSPEGEEEENNGTSKDNGGKETRSSTKTTTTEEPPTTEVPTIPPTTSSGGGGGDEPSGGGGGNSDNGTGGNSDNGSGSE